MILYLLGLVSVIVATSVEIQNADNYVTNEKYQERIAGGTKVDNIFKIYQVQVIANGDQFCSGSIINKYYILTAAHCVENTQPDDVFVKALSYEFLEGIYLSISKIVIHPEYDYPQNNNDVAYMRTTKRMNFEKDYIYRPAELDNPSTTFPNLITVSGWGRRENSQDLSYDLMEVNLTVIHNLRCQVMYPEIAITKNMFCAENTRDGGQGACKGDGGGPASRATYDKFNLVGISSFTRGCGAGMGPSVFTNLRAKEIRDFILNGTRINRQ